MFKPLLPMPTEGRPPDRATDSVSIAESSASLSPHLGYEPKLKRSCDACGIAKVKCARQHPRCQRCSAQGLRCIYRQSRKQVRTKISQHSSLPVGDSLPRCGSAAVHTHQHGNASLSGTPELVMNDSLFDSGLETELDSYTDFFISPPFHNTTSPHLQSIVDQQAQSSALIENLRAENLDVQSPTREHEVWDLPNIPSVSTASSYGTAESQIAFDSPAQAGSSTLNNTRSNSLCRAVQCLHEIHDCFTRASLTLQELNWRPDDFSKEGAKKNCNDSEAELNLLLDHGSISRSSVPPVQRLIQLNKRAIGQLDSISQCSCCSDTNMIILCSSIAGRMMRLYQLIGLACRSTGSTHSGHRVTSSLSRTNKLSREGDASSQASVPHSSFASIAFDDLDLDDDERKLLISQLVRSGLRKTAQVIESIFTSHQHSNETMNDCGVHVNTSLRQWLRAELKTSIENAV